MSKGEAAGDLIPFRRSTISPSLDYAIDLIQSWLERSLDRTDLDINTPKELPKRIIDVGLDNAPIVHLRDFSIGPEIKELPKGLYVCLSYRWPEDIYSSMKTTQDNISECLNGIIVADLPESFRDAIKITR